MMYVNVFVNCVGVIFVYWMVEEIGVELIVVVWVSFVVCVVYWFDVFW